MWYSHIAEVPHLNAIPEDIKIFFYHQENMLVTVWWALLPIWPRQFHPGSIAIFERGECILPVFLFTS